MFTRRQFVQVAAMLTMAGGVNVAEASTSSGKVEYPGSRTLDVSQFGATGDGLTDDSAAIRTALDALANNGGGCLYFPPGTYHITDTIRVSSDNVVLMGRGSTSRIKLSAVNKNGLQAFGTASKHLANITISDMWVELPQSGSGRCIEVGFANGILIDRCWATKAGDQGISIRGGSNQVVVRGCFAWNNGHSSGGDGISVRARLGANPGEGDINDVLISGNVCWENNLDGIDVNTNPVWNGSLRNVIVSGNVCRNNGGHGIDLKGSGSKYQIQHVSITGNLVHNNQGAIHLLGQGSGGISDVTIVSNVVYSNASNPGIWAKEALRLVIDANEVRESAGEGIKVEGSDAVVSNNAISKSASHGISISSSPRVTVSGNMCADNGQAASDKAGICLQGPGCRDCTVTGNLCTDTQSEPTQAYGIREVVSADSNLIVANRVSGNAVAQLSSTGGATLVRQNAGFVTEGRGTATIPNGVTAVAVWHGLSKAPVAHDISLSPTNHMGEASKFWVGEITPTYFTIYVNADPGPSGATFAWQVGST
ncbi:MAG TPA: right-handed parallel beta-helix repeat-containing protein [Symbiobacteriaceae bacterium]|nr:right-handed parallel beta-helix repeat-containing protein [Symbiobacteriaceae bacterium]